MITLKTPDQIKGIESSCRLLAELHDLLGEFIEPGMTTKDIDSYCYDFIISHKGRPAFLNYMGFPASACVSVNEEVIHGIPGKRKIEKGDLVSVDLGIDLDGYYSDAARTFIAGGSSTKENELLVKVTKECLNLGIDGAKSSNARIHDISAPIFKHANLFGFGVVRDYCGHGVGLALHEEPQVPNYVSGRSPNPRLRVGMVLAIEPMINLGSKNIRNLDDGWTVITADGKPSAHFEHTIAITDDGPKILTVAE